MTAAGQTINDRILAARHSIAGQGLAKAVCKATTEEIIGPKKKHLDYLLHCTNEPNVSIPTLANLLIERTQNPNWVVVFKGLITTHHLMCYGNERFTQYLASSNSNFQLSNYLDKSGVQGYDMSPFIRRYAKYMSEKSVSYRNVAFDFCKVKRGKDGGTLRTMSADKLLKTLPQLQQQIDSLLEFDCSSQDLNNGVINACFMLLFRDLIRLFACYNDGIINLLEKYFEMNKKQARDALDIYKKFLIRMDRVSDFLKVAENVGIEKGDIPDLTKAPSSLLEALEAHLASLEGRKPGSGGTTPTGTNRVSVAAAVNTLSTTSNAFGTAANVDEKTTEKLLQEEEAAMAKFRSTASASNPFAAAPEPAPAEETPNILDLFGVAAPASSAAAPSPFAATAAPAAAPAADGRASDDLLQLAGNPFANMLNAAGSGAPAFPPTSQPQFAASAATGLGGGTGGPPSFGSENAFYNAFGQPAAGTNGTSGGTGLFGEVLQPAGGSTNTADKPKVITGDLDSSLANLASNLTFGTPSKGGAAAPARGPPMGINNFQNQPMSSDLSSLGTSNIVGGLAPPLVTSPGGNSSLFGNVSSNTGNVSSLDAIFGPSPTGQPAGSPFSSAGFPSAVSPAAMTSSAMSSPFSSTANGFPQVSSSGNSLFPASSAFPASTSSPFGSGLSPSQSFPSAVTGAGLMTPSPSMPMFSAASSSPNNAFSATAFNNNNNIEFGKFGGPPHAAAATPASGGLTANDPFASLL